MPPKAYRWVAEMHEIAEFIGRGRPEHLIYEGAASLYEALASKADDDVEQLVSFASAEQ